ncbi:hypothetical protein V6N13_099182 [Hibiscus sabdariffa]
MENLEMADGFLIVGRIVVGSSQGRVNGVVGSSQGRVNGVVGSSQGRVNGGFECFVDFRHFDYRVDWLTNLSMFVYG